MHVCSVMTEFLMRIRAPAPSVMDHWDKDVLRSRGGMGSGIKPEEEKTINLKIINYNEDETQMLTETRVS